MNPNDLHMIPKDAWPSPPPTPIPIHRRRLFPQPTNNDHTLPITPIQVRDMMSYLEYLNDIRENGNHLRDLSLE